MKCKFERRGEYLVCPVCLFQLKTKEKPERLHKECSPGDITKNMAKAQNPSLLQQMGNAVVAGIKYALNGFKNVEEEEIKRRMEICQQCPFYDKEQNKCSKCGCFMKFKSMMESEHCPIGKW